MSMLGHGSSEKTDMAALALESFLRAEGSVLGGERQRFTSVGTTCEENPDEKFGTESIVLVPIGQLRVGD